MYLDHAATTPMLPEAARVLAEQLARTGNPSSLHASGRAARRVVEESRERLAAALGARPSEVVLTAGGTEADNLAVKGLFWARRTQDPAPTPDPGLGGRAPRRAGPGVLDGRARGRRARAAAGGRGRGARSSTRCATSSGRTADAGRADLGDVGEQRGRHAAAARRRRRARAPVRRARARRRGAGRRAGAGRLRCVRARRADASAGTRSADRAASVRSWRGAGST